MIHMHAHQVPVYTKRTRVVFLIDDDPLQLQMLTDFIKDRFSVEVHPFSNGEAALKEIALKPEVVFLDYHLDGEQEGAANGIEILKRIKTELPLAQVVMLSGQDKMDIAADCIKNGAFDYIVKGESAFSRLELILTNIDQMMDDVYFRKFNSDMLKLVMGVVVIGTIFVLYAIRMGWMKVTLHF